MASTDQLSQALVVGVSRYQNITCLPTTRDVPGVRDVLASPEYCAYPPERVKVVDEEAATRDNILKALDVMCDGAKEAGSRTFFYFSGHGGQGSDGSSYLMPVDARKGQYPKTAVSARELSSRLERCKGEVTVVLDCCYAAGMISRDVVADTAASSEPKGAEFALQDTRGTGLTSFGDSFRNDIQSRGRVVFAASRADAYAYGSQEAPYGIFTGHMLDALRGRASTDGFDVTVHQLFDYVQKHVVFSSENMQRPSFIANIETFYPLTRYPRRIEPSVVLEKDVYISYDRKDPVLRNWVARDFQPELERNGRSVWDYDDLGEIELEAVQEAIKKSKYIVILLTKSYLNNRLDEFKAAMAILQAIHTRTPRFIPILRERCDVPLSIQAFVGLDMSEGNQMDFRYSMDRLIKRVKKEPHVR